MTLRENFVIITLTFKIQYIWRTAVFVIPRSDCWFL